MRLFELLLNHRRDLRGRPSSCEQAPHDVLKVFGLQEKIIWPFQRSRDARRQTVGAPIRQDIFISRRFAKNSR